jgi:hypothetical protein
MRVLMQMTFPHEPFNTAVRDGSAGPKIQRILAEQKPEAAYFLEHHGKRSAVLVVDVADSSKVPAFCEPWFLTFNADVELHPAMSGQDMAASGLEALGKAW